MATATDLSELYEDVLPYLIIDVNAIQDEMVRHTANYAYLSQRLAQAKGRAADAKLNLDYQKAVMFLSAKQARDDDGKPISTTDAMAKAYVDIDDAVLEAKHKVAEAEKHLAFWQTVLDAMYQRSYMLTKLAEMQQHELLLAGSEYNEGIRQQLRSEVSDNKYMVATAEVRRQTQQAKVESMREVMNRKESD